MQLQLSNIFILNAIASYSFDVLNLVLNFSYVLANYVIIRDVISVFEYSVMTTIN